MILLKVAGAIVAAVIALWLLAVAWFLFCMWVSGKVWKQ